jgi:hypothetical protein
MLPLLPQEVNGAAYLVDAESRVTFNPVRVPLWNWGTGHTSSTARRRDRPARRGADLQRLRVRPGREGAFGVVPGGVATIRSE